ncbi:MAG: DNA repair protein RecO [Chloroflexi bacterium GWB2_49_20]|nr:MAG: DNA repair protein RecO [Chloroflexi bacterium GWB2_49_20]OGN77816.1 MAG: DNA repair protein RecO [Chloroflexi bacterium GWC2_49_37]OGN86130.1 MAG: DNA repair protein RecO [Chloroflexi bacterium GWD2_49_16]HCM96238.1 DNA repair protein RecO [Anaerolineae bacterium]
MKEQRSFRVEAVVLRHSNLGEADRLLVIYTCQRGKLRVVAKGARKMRSRKAGHVEPFMQVSLQLATAHGPFIVTDAETIEAYQPLRETLLRTGYAAYVVELIDRFSYEEEGENPVIFRLLTDTLNRIALNPDPWLGVRYYEVRLLDSLGFRPQLVKCINCQAEIKPEDQFFSPSQGGVLCPRCGTGLPGVWSVSEEALKYLRHLQRSSYPVAARARPGPAVQKEMETLMQAYFTYLLERELNTPGFIRRVRE